MFRILLFFAMLAATALIAVGFLGPIHPAFDTLANFRLHVSAGLVALAFLWSLRCSRVPAIVFAMAGFLGFATGASGLPVQPEIRSPAAGASVHRAFFMNMYSHNPKMETVIATIERLDPDVVMLAEFSWLWEPHVERLAAHYAHYLRCGRPVGPAGSLVLLSKFPVAPESGSGSTPRLCRSDGAALFQEFAIDGREVSIGVVHLHWPWPFPQPEQIDSLEHELAALRANALVAGDFNAATWSHAVRRFADAGGLSVVSGIGATWRPTLTVAEWPLRWPFWAGLPIDNVLEKGALRVLRAEALEPAGSDHRPILIEFSIE